jgi:hypothetical protein
MNDNKVIMKIVMILKVIWLDKEKINIMET